MNRIQSQTHGEVKCGLLLTRTFSSTILDHDHNNVKTVSLSVVSAARPAATPPPSNSSSEDSGDLSITASESVGVTIGATLGGALIVILVILGLVVLLCYCSTKQRSSYKSQ